MAWVDNGRMLDNLSPCALVDKPDKPFWYTGRPSPKTLANGDKMPDRSGSYEFDMLDIVAQNIKSTR